MAIFFTFAPTSNHVHSLQVENCDSNSRLVVDEDDNGKFRIERIKTLILLYVLITTVAFLTYSGIKVKPINL